MLKTWLIAGALTLAGIALYTGRHNWRWCWDRLLWVSVAFQVAGFILIAPVSQDILSRLSYDLTGLALLPDFLGHICFISATNALMLAVAYRLMPNPGRLRKYIEFPSAGAAGLMLLTFTLSHHTHQLFHCGDFFACPLGPWLRAYWVIFSLIIIYLISFLVYMLLAVRREWPESRQVANLYIAAILVGSIVCGALLVQGLGGGGVNPLWVWIPLCTASGLSFIAGYWTLVRNKVQ